MPRPNMFIDIYKNRRSKHKRVRLWLQADLGICRFDDLFVTNEFGEQVPIDLLRAAFPTGIPSISELLTYVTETENESEVKNETLKPIYNKPIISNDTITV